MSNKKIVLLLNSTQEYIRHIQESDLEKCGPEMNKLFLSITNVYIPLLNMFRNLEVDNIPFAVQMVFPPILCTLLEDPVVQAQYVTWLDKQIALGQKELSRCAGKTKIINLVSRTLNELNYARTDFTEKYSMRLLPQFASLQAKGVLELMTTCGTSAFLPHYSDMKEVLNAQIETGLLAHKYFFGEIPDGFWLPQMAYCSGVEKVVRSYGFNYTVLDPRSTLFGEVAPENGVFYPARFNNSLAAFTAMYNTDEMLFGEDGFSNNEIYRNENRDICFDLPLNELNSYIPEGSARFASVYKYFNKTEEDENDYSACPESDEITYCIDSAMAQAYDDAAVFVEKRAEELSKAEKLCDTDFVSEVCVINLDKVLTQWHEGINFLEGVFRKAAEKAGSFDFTTCNRLLTNQYTLQKIVPYYSSCEGSGYGENLLSSKNAWMMRYLRKASERMIDLSDRFPTDTGLKARLLNLAAKELMIAQDSGWAKMLDDDMYPEYVKDVFTKSMLAFATVFESLGSNVVSTEWLTNLEAEHPLFPWMNYRIFSKKQ